MYTIYFSNLAATRRRNALLTVKEIRLLGVLTDQQLEIFGKNTDSRQVKVSMAQRSHIIKRRKESSQSEAEVVIKKVSEAFKNAVYLKLPRRNENVFEIVGFAPSAKRHILIVIKHVPGIRATSGKDEWWLSTAYPFGKKKLNLMLKQNLYISLNGDA